MLLRFSLKWLLAATAYVGVAVLAFTQANPLFADALWFASWAALGAAILFACFAHGARRARACGFALFVGCYAAAAYLAPDTVPTTRVLNALGVQDPATASDDPASPPAASPLPVTRVPSRYVTFSARGDARWTSKLRAAHAVAMMAVGLLGSFAASCAVGPCSKPAASPAKSPSSS